MNGLVKVIPGGRKIRRAKVRPLGIMVGVGAVILDGRGRVLLVKHRPSHGPRKSFWKDRWIGPGGMLEFGESLEEGARREVREETGLEIDIVRALEPSDRLIKWRGRNYMQVVYVDFLARARRPTRLWLAIDAGQGRWFNRRELEALGDELHEDTRELLKRAKRM